MIKFDVDNGIQVIAIVDNQWGDTGKGKIAHLYAKQADVIYRGTGGANAGHTVYVKDKKFVQHLLPTAVTLNDSDKIVVMGNGMAINLEQLCKEIEELAVAGISDYKLLISSRSQVVMPFHIERDKKRNASQKNGGIGSTAKGIGPCYTNKIERAGIMIGDLYRPQYLNERLKKLIPQYLYDLGYHHDFQVERFDEIISPMFEYLMMYADRLKPYVADTITAMHRFKREGKKILIEGAQGCMLSIEFGTFPYVTSSDCSVAGTAAGAGLAGVDAALGIVKFPLLTRVGGGPFPTEIGASKYTELVQGNPLYRRKEDLINGQILYERNGRQLFYANEARRIRDLMNSRDPWMQSIGIRIKADEYGATTGRPRRIGWPDAVAARYAIGINGKHVILTKLDCLSGLNKFRICYGYEINGEIVRDFPDHIEDLWDAKPVYKSYEGYGDISGIKTISGLPSGLRLAIRDFEEFTGGQVEMISVGTKSDQIIEVLDLIT